MEDFEPKLSLKRVCKRRNRVSIVSHESTEGTSPEKSKTQMVSQDSKELTQRSSENEEEEKEEYICPICITNFDEVDPELITGLKNKVKALKKETDKRITVKASDPVIVYINNCDLQDTQTSVLSRSLNSSDGSCEPFYIVAKRDITNNKEEFLANFETNGICILKNCKHIFHKCCIKNWFKEHRTCPVCREKIYRSDSIRQYNSDDSSLSMDSSRDLDSFSSFEAADHQFIFDDIYNISSNLESLSVHLEEFDVRSQGDRVANNVEDEDDFYANSDKQISLIFTNGEQPLNDSHVSGSSSGSIFLEDIFSTNLNITE
ncbi:unnamed protein product [Moneuplotes crassus]|uniref:RING-type domain-containing protein n=1 Tax=Euplotes crassus TaxID=5936 RepID=A0AAD1UHH9_EUPCR|nr:unnamed protein product [Moneuplotes crassus]